MRRILAALFALASVTIVSPIFSASSPRAASTPSELQGAFRLPEKDGWTYVHLQGTPHEIGFQNGYVLAPESSDMLKVVGREAVTVTAVP